MPDHNELSKHLLQNTKYYLELLSSGSASAKAKSDGFDMPDNFAKYLDDAMEKTRIFIRDQTHVLELKAAQSSSKIAFAGQVMGPNSGGNGAAGTGW